MQALDTRMESLPATAGGHFVLHFYAAVFDLLKQLRAITGSDEDFSTVLAQHPFLRGYIAEIRCALPLDDPFSGSHEHWDAAIAGFERRCAAQLPIVALRRSGLSPSAIRLLMLIGLVEEDSRFGDLFAWLQPGTGARRLSLGLAERILDSLGTLAPAAESSSWRELEARGLARPTDADAPRTELTLTVPRGLWAVIRGEGSISPPAGRVAPAARARPEELIFSDTVRRRLAEASRVLADGQPATLVLRGDPGLDISGLTASLLSVSGRRAVMIQEELGAEASRQLGAWCTMTASAPVRVLELAPGATAGNLRPPGYEGPVIAVLGPEGGVTVEASELKIAIDLPTLTPELRHRVWSDAFGTSPEGDLRAALDGFRVSEGYARQIAGAALLEARLSGRTMPAPEDVGAAARSLNHQLLDGLADRIETGGSWDALVAAPATHAMLRVLEQQARNRERLVGRMRHAIESAEADGVRALFTGVSGTGKTLCARIIAGVLGKELYRVDLAAVVNKYIGETEKNLNRVLSRAEALDVVLLLDEGDALLGARTEVKSANDRYANLETNYLLQRLERYRGIIIVTTNYGENIDKAFQRRMDVVVPFFRPGPDERRAILEMHLPARHGISPELIQEATARCDLTGGQLRNVALRAVLAATGDEAHASDPHLMRALTIEHEKTGAVFPLGSAGRGDRPVTAGGASRLAGALRSSL